jgi:hypothetical protein
VKLARLLALGWLFMVGAAFLVWVITGVWLLHSPESGSGESFLMGLTMFLVTAGSLCVVLETSKE